MHYLLNGMFRPARTIGPAALLWVLCILAPLAMARGARAADAVGDDHQQAVAALADLTTAIDELVQADASYATDRNVYHRAAQRAINALSGAGYAVGPGTQGDTVGAIGHIDSLLDRKATPVWVTPLQGAETNIRAAVTHLQDAIRARELMDYQVAVSRALAYLEVARGRPTEVGLFGGLEGALANTVLGVPAGAQQQDACETPSAAPSFGTHDGYLAWVTVPTDDGAHLLAEDPGATTLSVQHGMIVLHTAAAKLVAEACGKRAQATQGAVFTAENAAKPAGEPAPKPAGASSVPPGVQPAAPQQTGQMTAEQSAPVSPADGPLPTLYTKAQAAAGKQIFSTKCVTCHGANLRGTAAPSVAGNDFLVTAQHNGWTLAIIRYIVFKLMPLNSPSTLSPTDDAALMAFLLASNCYPAGTIPFPSAEVPAFATIKLGPVPGQPDGQNAAGICKVN